MMRIESNTVAYIYHYLNTNNMNMAVKATYISKSNYTVYNGVYTGQTLYIIWDNDKIFARYGLESSPEALNVINNESFVWQINELLTIPAINQLMDDILPYINQLSEMSGNTWNGYQWVGKFDDEEKANTILDKIDEFIETDNEELPHFDIITPEYYNTIFISKTPAEMRAYVSGKQYLDEGILFSEDPYKFINFAIGMNASTADEYVGAIYNIFTQLLEFIEQLDDTEYNNNRNAKSLISLYDSAISYYYDIISEPDKTSYVDMIIYGNQYFTTCMNIFDTDELLQNDELSAMCEQYIVELDDNLVEVNEELDAENEEDSKVLDDDVDTDIVNDNTDDNLETDNNTQYPPNTNSADGLSDNYAFNPNGNSESMIGISKSSDNEMPDEDNEDGEENNEDQPIVDDSYWKKDNGAKAI